jgi:hypothetical protein
MPEQLLLDVPLALTLRLRRHAGITIMPESVVNESAELIVESWWILASWYVIGLRGIDLHTIMLDR